MKNLLAVAVIVLPLTAAAEECRWADGSYRGEEGNFEARFTVNADCSQMEFESSGNEGIQAQDVPQSFPLTLEEHGWVADINGVDATLAKNGDFVDFIGEGINTRLEMRPIE